MLAVDYQLIFGSTSLLQWLLLEAGLLLVTKIWLSQLWELLSVLLLASGLGVTLVNCSHSTLAKPECFCELVLRTGVGK